MALVWQAARPAARRIVGRNAYEADTGREGFPPIQH